MFRGEHIDNVTVQQQQKLHIPLQAVIFKYKFLHNKWIKSEKKHDIYILNML